MIYKLFGRLAGIEALGEWHLGTPANWENNGRARLLPSWRPVGSAGASPSRTVDFSLWFALTIWLTAPVFLCSSAYAQDKVDPLSWDRNISGLFKKYCYRCHREEEQSGNVDLARDVDLRMLLDHRENWEKATVVLKGSEMPPSDERQPSVEERALLVQFLEKTLDNLDCTSAHDPGKPILRRLNRVEYDNCIEDLTGMRLKLADGFVPDGTGYGFDNLAEALSFSPVQIEQYHDAAKAIVDAIRDTKESRPELCERMFGKQVLGDEEVAEARKAISIFAARAFRRPAEEGYVDKLMGIYAKARSNQEPHESAQEYLFRAVLISPQFLTRIEKNRPGITDSYPVDDYELASRLSFFLWSRSPDEVLLQLAESGSLSQPQILAEQIARLLADPRCVALVDNFFGQWLSLKEVETHKPDATTFPEFNESLRHSMMEEVRRFVLELVQQDKSVTALIDADYTYLDERLARHYGIDGVIGEGFTRVALTDRRRGGILTSAAFLMSQADPARTNVPRRGNFVAGRILGAPPPPPPPNIPPLESSVKEGEQKSLRQILELHRSQRACANCHAKMDPLGFGLENYDAIGRWRTEDGPFPIDASGQLISGRSFSGPLELKDVLLEQKDAFAKTFVRNLLIYAYGRGLQGSDECVVRDVLESSKPGNYQLGAIVAAIVRSYPFLHRRNPTD